jgi:hypothetical protein
MNETNTALAQKYPVGIQDFEYIRNNGFVYVDKTAYIYQLAQASKYVFLSRPRRFGKSLLCSTMKSYFEGRRELFQGLAVEQLEQDWTAYPVIHLSLSRTKPSEPGLWKNALLDCLRPYEAIYGEGKSCTLGGRLGELIQKAFAQTGKPVALIVDEYDAPLLSVLDDPDALAAVRAVMKDFYSPLKDVDPYLRFCFITGVTKFSQLSIFSTINNLRNISMLKPFAAICGISESELHQALGAGVAALSQTMECSVEACFAKLKELYDGYHFAKNSEDIYNPFSLLRALDDQELQFYWFSTGTPTFLIQSLQHFQVDPTEIDGMTAASSQFDVPTEAMDTAIPLLYQSGYLTIKGYHSDVDEYVLGIPNKEVRVGLSECLLPAVSGVNSR